MAIEWFRRNELVIECDTCGKEDEAYVDDFYDGFEEFKDEGWINYYDKSEGVWYHFCSR